MINWQAPEYEERPKDVSWYWITIILAIGLLTFALWQKNFLFAVFIVIAEVLILAWGHRPPQTANFEVNEKTLGIDGKKYPLNEFKAWSLNHEEDEELADFTLHYKSSLRGELRMKLPPQKLPEFANYMQGKLPRIEHEHSFLESLERLLRF